MLATVFNPATRALREQAETLALGGIRVHTKGVMQPHAS